ncbi:MAG: type II toxin-antitoxin system RelE/ParE family toxin [Cyanosarcina radialis HA8281-LM2]|jgi:mRNA-degrading endonuclease RelE of RelBE toxin-antitoxin system|nr:type II toxin-antitoxin system RelE/ParE family toxin [Cyanosarcina radialis HA8281-LM2]
MSDSRVTIVALPTFTRNIRTLKKKYRNILEDLQPILDRLESGETPGDRIPDLGYPVFKVRVRNTDIQKGKSGGYRLIYYLKTTTSILLLTLYTKSDRDDVAAADLQDIIEDYDRS